jgi:hypothetical protein
MGMTATNKNYIHKEINSRLNKGACYFVWMWNLVSHPKRKVLTEGVSEQGAEEDIWT